LIEDGYTAYWNFPEDENLGSGLVVFTLEKPLSVDNGIGIDEIDKEGNI